MPKGPRREIRPADVIGAAVMVGRIATGEVEDTGDDPTKAYHSRGGKKGGAANCGRRFQTETLPRLALHYARPAAHLSPPR